MKPEDRASHDLGWSPDRFDMIAFSISFEPDYLNAVTVLKYFNIPLERKDRGTSHPLILAGGSAIFINPEPLADCVDVFFIGEGEGMAEKFFSLFVRNVGDDPRNLLNQAAAIKGIYVPQFYWPEYKDDRLAGYEADPQVGQRKRT